MMKDMSQTEEDYAADIKADGVLDVDGANAKLTVKKTTKDANGTSTTTMTQNFKVDGGTCLITH